MKIHSYAWRKQYDSTTSSLKYHYKLWHIERNSSWSGIWQYFSHPNVTVCVSGSDKMHGSRVKLLAVIFKTFWINTTTHKTSHTFRKHGCRNTRNKQKRFGWQSHETLIFRPQYRHILNSLNIFPVNTEGFKNDDLHFRTLKAHFPLADSCTVNDDESLKSPVGWQSLICS